MGQHDTRAPLPFPFMSVDVEVSGTAALVTLVGECDTSEAGRLAEALQTARAQATEIQIDVSGLTFLDSGALQVLYRAATDPDGARTHIVVLGATPGIRRVLQIARLDTYLDVRDSEDSAPRVDEARLRRQRAADGSQLNGRPAMSDAV